MQSVNEKSSVTCKLGHLDKKPKLDGKECFKQLYSIKKESD